MGVVSWLAIAAIGAALVGPIAGPLPVILVGVALGLVSVASRLAGRRWIRRTDPATIGLLLIGLRLANRNAPPVGALRRAERQAGI